MAEERCAWCQGPCTGYVETNPGRWVNNKRGGKDFIGSVFAPACSSCAGRMGLPLHTEANDIYRHD